MYLHGTSRINQQGHLEIGGCDAVELTKQYGTPLYVYDEELIRNKCRSYVEAFKETGLQFQVAYASKAFCTMKMSQVIMEEGLSLDVVSGGELYTAIQAGFPPERIHFHGNNKSIEEIQMALDVNIGCFVVDNFYELELLNELAGDKGVIANILLRVTPGVEAHTHDYISTGQQDTKFGFDMGSGMAFEAVNHSLLLNHINLLGLHSHIGSQIFDTTGFKAAAERLSHFLIEIRDRLQYTASVLNLGGGFGIRYEEEDQPLPVKAYIHAIASAVKQLLGERSYPLPEVWIEPGRSIAGEAGTTLYTVGSVKDLPTIRKYVSVDGGMTDNLRPALYQAKYEALLANRADEPAAEVVTIAGKCCESGDLLIKDYTLPAVQPGDILAVSCTGAYGFAMANNYNRIPRPAVVFVRNGRSDIAVERETYEDIIQRDRLPSHCMTI